MRYRKRPVVIQAFRFFANDVHKNMDGRLRNWPKWAVRALRADGVRKVRIWNDCDKVFWCGTHDGPMRISDGDWIIRGVKGEIYPCRPDVFEMTYEAA